jgi:hypothetical protein
MRALPRLAAAALLLTPGCQFFRSKPAYTDDPLLHDRKPVLGMANLPPMPPGPDPAPPPAPPLAEPPVRTAQFTPPRPP